MEEKAKEREKGKIGGGGRHIKTNSLQYLNPAKSRKKLIKRELDDEKKLGKKR